MSARELHAAQAARFPFGGAAARYGISGSSFSSSSTITSCSASQALPDLTTVRFVTEHGAVDGAAGCISGDVTDTPEELKEFTYVNTRVQERDLEGGDSTARWLNLPFDLPHDAPRVWL